MKELQLIWVMKNGEKILVRDMTDSHLLNCISSLKERRIYPFKDKKRNNWIHLLTQELRKRKYKKLKL